MTNGRSSLCATSFHTSAEKTTVYIQNRRHIIGHLSLVIFLCTAASPLAPLQRSGESHSRRQFYGSEISGLTKIKSFAKKSWHWLRGSPLLWRGARGEANRVIIFTVNIQNNNTKNSNTTQFRPTIEIVGLDVKGSSVSRP